MSRPLGLFSRFYFRQIALGLAAMHAQHIAHRDIKLENVMLGGEHQTTVKLVDYGTAKDISPARLTTWKYYDPSRPSLNCKALCGTLKYVAPEVLQAGEENMYDGRKADMWALGVVLFVCLMGHYPYDVGGALGGVGGPGAKADEQSLAILKELLGEIEAGWSMGRLIDGAKETTAELRDLLSKMLEVDPAKRLHAEEVLRHPWLQLPADPALAALNDKPRVWTPAEVDRLIAGLQPPGQPAPASS